jgi:dihydroorotase
VGYVHEGSASLLSGLEATPSIAEEVVVMRDIAVARYVDGPIHLTHISTAGSVEAIRGAKRFFTKITSDTCPHYFSLSDEATLTFDTNAKVNPPLRSRADVEAIKQGLQDGTIDIIATDHAPHEMTSKDVEFNLATYGISGFETALALSLNLVRQGVLTLPDLIRKMTVNPARLLGLPLGEIGPGKQADLTVFNPEIEWSVDRNAFVSKGKNTPFHGWTVKGKGLLTIVDGEIAYRDTRHLP